ncbi:phenylalanine--tRNA ligase subunit beta [Chloroflexi bacterium TSY]|nr:phenylalanine--tRNA ligase subunit beta [Chloroflexi bacterium TSY]
MLIPLSWLREYVEITLTTDELERRLTMAGLEVESSTKVGDWWDPDLIVVGEVIAVHPHPDADRLVLVDVDYGGTEPERVVTGAPNLYQFKGMSKAEGTLSTTKAPFARAGAFLMDAYSDKVPRPKKKLKPSKIRGVKSSGMICSELELGLSEEHEGILLLPDDAPIGVPLREYLGDDVLELELTPDMARCLNLIGVAREVAALTGGTLHLPADEVETSGDDQASDYFDVRIDEPELSNRYVGLLIQGVEIGPSPKWLQDRLLRAGQRPINNIVDITNYVMLEWGQPLHAFDYDILVQRARQATQTEQTSAQTEELPTIIVRRARANTKFTTLDGEERLLDDSMLMIADTGGDIALAGVMGGLESEVSDQTHNVLLEAATFEGINNRRTAMKLRMTSEASHLFARGIPATLNPIAARRAAELMRLYAGGRVVPGMVDAYPVEQQEQFAYTSATDIERILGLSVSLDQAAQALEKLDFQVARVDRLSESVSTDATFALQMKNNEPLLKCTAPWHRLDVRYPADLIEEVARVIGYEEVGTTLINDVLPAQRRNYILETEERIRDILAGIGLQETINHPLTTVENHLKLLTSSGVSTTGISMNEKSFTQSHSVSLDADEVEGYITVTNPVSQERRSMRRSMLVSVMENLAYNLRFRQRLATFEIGRIYLPDEGESLLPLEERRLSISLTGPRQLDCYYTGDSIAGDVSGNEMDFFDLKGIIETLFDALEFVHTDLEFIPKPDTGTYGSRCAEIRLRGESVGLMGEIHPQVANAYALPASRICTADLRIGPLVKEDWSVEPMQPISNYPPVVEDLAFEVAESVTVRQVEDALRKAGGEILTAVDLFDIYRGDPIPDAHKSMAYRLTYQSPKRSLSEKEVAKLRQRIIRHIEKVTGGKLRGE